MNTYTNQNKEFLKREIIKKSKDSFDTILSIARRCTKTCEVATATPNALRVFSSREEGENLLTDDIYLSCNVQYLCVDLRVFYTPRSDTTNFLRPTRSGISFSLNETKYLREIIENIDTKLNINALDDYLESDA